MQKKVIGVLGATGQLGAELLKKIGDNYKLVLLVRTPSKIPDLKGVDFEVLEGSSTDAELVNEFILKSDVVISCLGASSRSSLIMETSYRNLLKAAQKKAVSPRCILISSVGLGGSSSLIKMMLSVIAGRASIEDYDRADKLVYENKSVPSVLVRAYALTNRGAKNSYKITQAETMTFAKSITRADLATFMYECIENEEWDHSAVMLSGS